MTRRVLFFVACCLCFVDVVQAEPVLKLPYSAGESMLVSRGYDTPSTHVNKDRYALDFVQGGCKSYGTPVRAAERGRVTFVNERDTWGGGYGKNIILAHEEGKTSRYAHLSKYGNNIENGAHVRQGQILGYQGNTGNVLGTACAAHPGTHLHFSYLKNNIPIKPEPMSGYPLFDVGNWYISDNLFLESNEQGNKKSNWFSSLWDIFTSTFVRSDPPRIGAKNKSNNNLSREIDVKVDSMILTTSSSAVVKPRGTFVASHAVYDIVENTSEIEVLVDVRNTGDRAWEKDTISIHIVGGESGNSRFYHPSWLTQRRPTKIYTKVLPGMSVIAPFIVHVPEDEKSSVQFQIVFEEDGLFSRIDNGFFTIDFVRRKNNVEDHVNTVSEPVDIEETFNEENSVLASTNTVALFIPEIYLTSSGGSLAFAEVASKVETNDGLVVKEEIPLVATPVPTSTVYVIETPSSTSEAMLHPILPVSLDTSSPAMEDVLSIEVASSTDDTTPSSTEKIPLNKEEVVSIPLYCSESDDAAFTVFSPKHFLDAVLADSQHTITLTAENGPYVLGIDTKVPYGKTLVIEEGVVIYGGDKQASLIIEGELIVKGSSASPVLFTSLCGEDAGQAGDWSHIYVKEGGSASITHASVRYAGYPMQISHGDLATLDTVSRVFVNHGGSLSLRHVTIQESHVATVDKQYSAYVWIENGGGQEAYVVSEYSVYSDGYRAIHIEGTNSDQRIQGKLAHNQFHAFTSPEGPLTIHRDVPHLETNLFENNSRNGVYLNSAVFIGSHMLQKDQVYWISGAVIEKDSSVLLEAGVIVKMLPGADIFVYGHLEAEGTEELPVRIMPDSTTWGSIIAEQAIVSLRYTDLYGGGLSASVPSSLSRMIYAVDSKMSIGGSHLHDSRMPGALIDAKNSSLVILYSLFSWKSLPAVPSWKTYGIFMNGGVLTTLDTVFHNVVVPVHTTPDTVVNKGEDNILSQV